MFGQHRRQPGDAQRLMSLSQHDAVPLIDVIDGEQLYIHLLQTGHHTVGNVKLLQRHRLARRIFYPANKPDGALGGNLQQAGIIGACLTQRLAENPCGGVFAALAHGVVKTAQRIHIPLGLGPRYKNPFSLHAFQKSLKLQRRQRTANGHPVEPIGLHQLIFRGYGCAGQVFFFFDLTADHLAQLDIKRGFIADFTHDRMPRFLRGGER